MNTPAFSVGSGIRVEFFRRTVEAFLPVRNLSFFWLGTKCLFFVDLVTFS